MRSLLRPPPSSTTSMTMLPESWKALSSTRPFAGLPAAARAAGGSMPWSMAFLTRCISGSPIFSTTDLSSSVSAPLITSSMSLPSSLETSRATRWKRLKVSPICTMRSCRAESRMLSTSRESTEVASTRVPSPLFRASRLAEAPAITSSPTRSMSWSSLSAWMRIRLASAAFFSETVFCLAAAASTISGWTLFCWIRMLPRAASPCPRRRLFPRIAGAGRCQVPRWVSAPLLTRISPRRMVSSGKDFDQLPR
jgi:hypothetical protein